MQYAYVEGERHTASPGLRGECPHCGSVVVSKCGDLKVWHWSHLGKRHCDRWWEPETEWHRDWKGHFPTDWHEVGHLAPDGERHIADIKAPHGLVIEFQHSAIADVERTSRTTFYGNMVWVVDGLRRMRDRPRFLKWRSDLRRDDSALWSLDFPEEVLPREWFDCQAPVFFDFGREQAIGPDDPVPKATKLWCLLPRTPNDGKFASRLLVQVSVSDFIANAQTGHPMPNWADIPRQLAEARHQAQIKAEKEMQEQMKRQRQYRWARRSAIMGRRL